MVTLAPRWRVDSPGAEGREAACAGIRRPLSAGQEEPPRGSRLCLLGGRRKALCPPGRKRGRRDSRLDASAGRPRAGRGHTRGFALPLRVWRVCSCGADVIFVTGTQGAVEPTAVLPVLDARLFSGSASTR